VHTVEVLCAGAVPVCSGGCGICSLSYAGGIGFHYGRVRQVTVLSCRQAARKVVRC